MSSARQREKVQALGHRTHGRIAKASSSWRMSRALQRRHSPANEQQPFDKDSLVCFAVAAAASIRRECNILTKLPRLSPFLAILASLLSEVEERLGGETPPAEARVLKLLAILEWVAKWPDPFEVPTKPANRSSYPSLVQLINNNEPKTRACIRRLAESSEAIHARKKCQRALKAFANVKAAPRGPEILELTKTTEKTDNTNNEAREGLQALYWTLCQLCQCAHSICGAGFKANVVVGYQALSKADDCLMVESFFLHNHTESNGHRGEWKETQIKVLHDQRSGQDLTDVKPRAVRFVQTGSCVLDFCKLISSQELGRLRLQVSGGHLFDDGLDFSSRKDGISLKPPSVSLASVLASASLGNDSQRKLLLSYLLAKAVWEFYDSDWIAEAWSKHEIHFMRQRVDTMQHKILLNYRPFISADFGGSVISGGDANTETSRRSHIFPKILALGITLLEIELGEPLEQHYASEYLDANGQPRANANHMAAGDFITSNTWKSRKKVYRPIRQAIDICVKPDISQLGTDPSQVRKNFYGRVVVPLRTFFGLAFDCDGCPENFDPGPISFDGVGQQNDDICRQANTAVQCMVEMPQPHSAVLNGSDYPRHSRIGIMQGVAEEGILLSEDCELFGSESQESNDPRMCKETDKWLYKFKLLRTNHRIGSGAAKRYKVAILDTGVDTNHPMLRRGGRIIKSESFMGDGTALDISGHGTHIAGIIIELTSNVDLYIAKFTNSREYGNDKKEVVRERIIKALQHARLIWKVDMISLSFGFSKVGAKDAVQKEIESCLNNNLVVFASASNDGGNRPRTYPGKYNRVICIHSATGTGDHSSFSPTPETDSGQHNFSAVGECVKSYWPMKEAGTGTHKYMSGTSFATPIAVSIAVFMLGYIDRKMSNYEWNIEPLSPEGVRVIFDMMSRGNRRDGYDWLSPEWFFTKYNEDKIQQDLIHELRGYPKT